MHWHKPLAFTVTPKSGPLRPMESLLDANHALTDHLPKAFLQRPHWWKAGWFVFHAADTGDEADIWAATNEIADALDLEGWMDLRPRNLGPMGIAAE
jgi:hypothetical protein